MGEVINSPVAFTAWGPFVRDNYRVLRVTRTDIIIASTVFGFVILFAASAAYIAVIQTRSCQRPTRSGYIWMVWLEWAACVVLAVECLLYLLREIRPSFYFFMSILLCWVVQVQLLLQIIVNRIRIILHDKTGGRQLVVGTAVIVTMINISVFCIWIPARLQISQRWIHINAVWDRIEKVLYLFLDAYLNFYFIRAVNANLVESGLKKYNHLVRFNQRIIIFSLSMDVTIIGAMSIPNGFFSYAMFHPLAYLVKLNIEMSMAHLIKTIALGQQYDSDNFSFPVQVASSPEDNDMSGSGIFAEPPWQRRSLIKILLGCNHNHSYFEKSRPRMAEEILLRKTSVVDLELQSQKHTTDEENHIRRGKSGRADSIDLVRESRKSSDEKEDIAYAEPVAAPKPVYLRCRLSEAG
ncbi:hypothetical protein EJ02DRAFT_342348 [Clathrospora elynae]|uniref:Integral membrane protein n=1 Tax=Clathrospora elynae TaxID=706981 RepID=A0A6A5STB0_9PLEO|nr:hypothetical protein EJ02DRAFT_342348 [Clathrospora elynae]